jgi:hypothetical protein
MTPIDRAALKAEVLDWIASWLRSDSGAADPAGERFDSLALRLFAFQFEHIPAFAAFCRFRGATPDTVHAVSQIPLVPVTAFKSARLATDAAAQAPVAVFETSGTSDGQPGRVTLHDTSLYDASLHAGFQYFVTPDATPGGLRCVSLVPGPAVRPHSSLGHMVQRLFQRWDDGGGSSHLGMSAAVPGLDLDGLHRALHRARDDGRPVLLLATSLALELWLDSAPAGLRLPLPPGSRLMVTGGPKGRRLQLTRADQHARLGEILQLDADLLVGELGMTELATPRYETTARHRLKGDVAACRAHAAPPWLRSRILRPADRFPCEDGALGMVAHLDLANLDTCAFLLTADLGRLVAVEGAGQALELAGRIPGSEWRGCGLDAEDLVQG